MNVPVTSDPTVGGGFTHFFSLHPFAAPFVYSYLLFSLSSQVLLIQPSAPPHPPHPHPHPALSLSPLPQTHALTHEHTHSFSLLPCLPLLLLLLPCSPCHISIFSPLSRAAGGSRWAVTYPIAALESVLAHRHGRKTGRWAGR